jgi:hypothetical protein
MSEMAEESLEWCHDEGLGLADTAPTEAISSVDTFPSANGKVCFADRLALVSCS